MNDITTSANQYHQLEYGDSVLPLHTSKQDASSAPSARADDHKQKNQPHDFTNVKLMIISDDPINAEVMRDYLITSGYQSILVAHDATTAFDTIFQESPDAILYENSELTEQSFDLLKKINDNTKTRLIPLLLLTVTTTPSVKLKALELGVVDIIAKPASANELSLRLRNILSIKTYHDQIANFDPLTKLPNKEAFIGYVDRSLKYAKRYNTTGAILEIGLSRFKHINDAYGITVADQLLRSITERIKKTLLHSDITAKVNDLGIDATICRTGDDVFSLLLPTITKTDDAAIISLILYEQIAKPHHIDRQEIYISCNIGIALLPNDGETKDIILHSAISALHQAKDNHRANYSFFSKEHNSQTTYRLTMENDMRKALAADQFEMYYQPKVSLASQEVVGAEALIRWQHPELGFVSPEEFIPIAEESDLILDVGDWTINAVVEQISTWKASGLTPPRIALNVSSLQLKNAHVLNKIEAALNHANIDASWLTVELTETAVMDNIQEMVATLNAIKALGAKISIDDFGTGYSSQMQLKQLPLDELKIDRMFTIDIGRDKNSEAIILATIAMAHNLGFHVVAEGVETQMQLDFLLEHGCNDYQGYLFSPAISTKEFSALIEGHST